MDSVSQINDSNQQSEEQATEMIDGSNDNDDHASSSDDSNDSESHEVSQNIVSEMHFWYGNDKTAILTELVKSRIQQARVNHQIEVFKLALAKSAASKTKLQLDLACSNRMIVYLQESAKEQTNLTSTVTQQYNISIDMIEELDLKRVKLIKDTQALGTAAAALEENIDQIENELHQQTSFQKLESDRNCALQLQISDLQKNNSALNDLLSKAEMAHQSLISSHSAELNEYETRITQLNEQLVKAEARITNEMQTNSALKNNVESVLAEKILISTEVAKLENRLAEMEKEMEDKLQDKEKSYRILLEKENMDAVQKYNQFMEDALQYKSEIARQTETIEKMCNELTKSNECLDRERNKTEDLENKIVGIKNILEDRNNEIYALHAKLNGEQKRFDEQKQQLQQKYDELRNQLDDRQNDLTTKNLKITQLDENLATNVLKISAMETQFKEKEEELQTLKTKLINTEQLNARITQLEAALAEQVSKATSLEQQLLEKEHDNRAMTQHGTLQVTSTPCHPIELESSVDVTPSKKSRVSDTDVINLTPSGTNYSTFQSNVLRKRAPLRLFGRNSPNTRSPPPNSLASIPRSFFGANRQRDSNEDLNVSLSSTINIDDDPLETASVSNHSSSVRMVKPFFRNPHLRSSD
ncbi:putative leucine-rich repeat-containing protein DDB_G0290503 isoform X2 [Malaya genurostris]|uniref:putative leucine-rich repeat-containing protein DDB_G0290503 isoform X2 n=1 Tax=Malaya genurostris TaxID=325434 RepID=UPI0026F3955B|nr:putative leucine-rich repeat-containing protein DDB_G0290503 isoform X2 [Malaya genurostris]